MNIDFVDKYPCKVSYVGISWLQLTVRPRVARRPPCRSAAVASSLWNSGPGTQPPPRRAAAAAGVPSGRGRQRPRPRRPCTPAQPVASQPVARACAPLHARRTGCMAGNRPASGPEPALAMARAFAYLSSGQLGRRAVAARGPDFWGSRRAADS